MQAMIQLKCGTCGRKLQAKDEHAGRTLKCPNCQSPVTVPGASPGAPIGSPTPPPLIPPQQPQPQQPQPQQPQPQAAAQTIVVQVQQQGSGLIGPARKSFILVWLLAAVCAGLQYFYLGQTGKGVVFTLLTLFVWGPFIIFTCGIGLVGAVPYGVFLLVDSLVVAVRMRTQAVSQWRFF
jgi:TM2 domain-containing membrane protein YozV/DNA-directed RNA polymerase subunit RPC12/RpoP